MRWREFGVIAFGVAVIYLPLSLFPAPDLHIFLFPWLDEIRASGLSVPVGNYSPPYIYLLWAASPLPNLVAVKLISVLGAAWLAWCVLRLALTLGAEPKGAALMTLVLPTVVLNAAVLGQCDTFWTGFCLLAISSALKGNAASMALWAGFGFAFKAQAAFVAPFCMWIVIERRAWPAITIPPLVYLFTMIPAALCGWPLIDLLTVYLRQPQFTFIGDAPNLWAVPHALGVSGPSIFPLGYAMGAAAALAILFVRKRDLLMVALVAALAIPFLLPKMMERYFFFADVLSFVVAYTRRDRRSIAVAAFIQTGSFGSIIAYLTATPWLNALASAPIAAALALVLYALISEKVNEAELGAAPSVSDSHVTDLSIATSS